MSFHGKSFLKLLDFSPAEIAALLDLAAELKAKKKAGIPHRLCEGKSIALYLKVRALDFGLRSCKGCAEGFRVLGVTHMHCLPEG